MATLAPPTGPTSRHLLPGSEYGDGSVGIRAGRHLGIDFQPAIPGGSDWIYAVESGTVEALFTTIPPGDKRNPLYAGHTGNIVAIRATSGRVWTYQHGTDFQVTLGQKVKAGDRLCRMWRSGRATGNHLHLGLRINGKFVDPEPVLRKAGAWPIGNTYYTASTPASTQTGDWSDMATKAEIKAAFREVLAEHRPGIDLTDTTAWRVKDGKQEATTASRVLQEIHGAAFEGARAAGAAEDKLEAILERPRENENKED